MKRFLKSIILAVPLLFLPSCFTIEKDEFTADGSVIPGKKVLNFLEYEYICEPTYNYTHQEMEQILDRYGRKGWRLAGFMQRGGNTHAFCLMR